MTNETNSTNDVASRSVFDAAAPIPGAPNPNEYVRGFADGFGSDAPFFQRFGTAPTGGAAFLSYRRSKSTSNDAESLGNGAATNAESDAESRAASATVAAARARGVGIAGAGLMGISIAAAFLGGGFPVWAFDAFPEALETASNRVERELTAQRRRRGVAQSDERSEAKIVREIVSQRFRTTARLDELAARPVVVETIPEKAKIKKKFYRELGAVAQTPTTLLSNASSIRISELALGLATADENTKLNRERFCGFHFFHPVCRRSLLEIVRGDETASETLAAARKLGDAIFKTPILVGDGPGFLVNRLLQPVLNESLALLEEGVPAMRIEKISRRFGSEAGPLRIMDEIGLDVSMHAGWTFFKAFPKRTLDSAILTELVREGKLGRKTKQGFYRFAGTASWEDDATLDFDERTVARLEQASFETKENAVENVVENAGKNDVFRRTNDATDEELALRIAIAVLFEGARLIEDGIVDSFREADAGLVLALGFPPEKGGVFYWAASFGLRRLLAEAEKWRALGERFVAPEILRRFAKRDF